MDSLRVGELQMFAENPYLLPMGRKQFFRQFIRRKPFPYFTLIGLQHGRFSASHILCLKPNLQITAALMAVVHEVHKIKTLCNKSGFFAQFTRRGFYHPLARF